MQAKALSQPIPRTLHTATFDWLDGFSQAEQGICNVVETGRVLEGNSKFQLNRIFVPRKCPQEIMDV